MDRSQHLIEGCDTHSKILIQRDHIHRLRFTITGKDSRSLTCVISTRNSPERKRKRTGRLGLLPQTISTRRSRFIRDGLHERIGFANYNRFPVPLSVTLTFGADFRDIFDVRGFHRDRWGELLPPMWEDGVLQLRYNGLEWCGSCT